MDNLLSDVPPDVPHVGRPRKHVYDTEEPLTKSDYNKKYNECHADYFRAYYTEKLKEKQPCPFCGKILFKGNMAYHKKSRSCKISL